MRQPRSAGNHVGVKHPGHSLVAASDAGLNSSRLFYVHDQPVRTPFPCRYRCCSQHHSPSSLDRTTAHHSHFTLQAVNSTNIPTYGVRSLTLDLGLRRTFRWTFIVADVKKPILGADFLSKFGLLVDVRHCQLSDTTTNLKVHCILSSSTPSGITRCTIHPDNPYLAFLAKFPDVAQACSTDRPVKHSVTHHIRTTGPHALAVSLRNASELLDTNLSICWNLVLFVRHGLHPYIWCQRRPLVIGDLVGITGHLTA